jgi:anti-sigma regulatory factor (Ser/Thr protein kinase)
MVAQNEFIAELTYREYAQCELPAELALVPEAAGKLRAWCLRRGLDAQAWAPVELALVEGLNNAIEHGCHGMSGSVIRVRWRWEGNLLEIEISDPGNFLPGPGEVVRLPHPLAEGGRGTFVMTSLMDSVTHELRGNSHVLVLGKQLGPASDLDADLAATLEAMTGEVSASYETITALFHFGEELASAQTFDDFFENALARLLKLVGGDEVLLRLADPGGRLKLVSSRRAAAGPDFPEFLEPQEAAIEAQVFRESEKCTVEDCTALGWHDPLRSGGGSALVCPILFLKATIGVLAVMRRQRGPYFTAGENRLISTVAEFLGIAWRMARSAEEREIQQRTERELEIAAEIQRSLLPRDFPETGQFRICGLSQAAHEVGGDFFDVLPIGDRGVLLAIADVMGKGMPAALLATILRTAIRAHTNLAEDPGRLLTVVNQQLAADLNRLGMFITAQIIFLPNDGTELIFASAGHCPLLKVSRGAKCASQSPEGGIPLGVLDDVEYESMSEPIASGDCCVLLTDGIYEARSATGEILGLELLAQLVPVLCAGEPRTACERLLASVADYSAGEPASDDRTLLIAQRL